MSKEDKIKLAAACTLLSVAEADENLDNNEIKLINDILQDFFSINSIESKNLIDQGQILWDKSKDIFDFGNQLNKYFSKDDKLDFIFCIFEVAYADGNLHYLEHHTIKKIANILNIQREDIIAVKAEMESYID